MADEKDTKEVVDDRRFFYTDDETKYFIEPPGADDIRGADWQYSKTYTKCLMEDIPTSAEMMDILTRRGIIGPEFEQRATELAQNLSHAISELNDAETLDEKRTASISVARAREELFQWNQRLNGPMNNTTEQIADDARLEFLTSCMVVDSDGKRVWDSYNTYLKEKSQSLALKSRFEVMLYLQGLDSDFLDQTPEARAMKEVETEIIAKAHAAIQAAEAVAAEEAAEKAAAETEAAKEDDTEPAAKSKRPAKKKKTE